MAFINSGPNITDFLNVKYAQLQQHADAATTAANSAATQAQAQARLVGTEADVNNARLPYVAPGAAAAVKQTQAQTGLLGAQTNETNTLTPLKAEGLAGQNQYQGIINRFLPDKLQTNIDTDVFNNAGILSQIFPNANGISGVNPLTGQQSQLGQYIRRRTSVLNPLLDASEPAYQPAGVTGP